jgi:hypothetical protein
MSVAVDIAAQAAHALEAIRQMEAEAALIKIEKARLLGHLKDIAGDLREICNAQSES